MAEPLDMSLDDIIKNNKKSGSSNFRGRGGASSGSGSGSGPGPSRRFHNRGLSRPTPYSTSKAPDAAWSHDMFVDQCAATFSSLPARTSAIETGIKLYVSNLDYGVSNEDVKELFSEVGDLKRYSINYDKSGRSKGTAEVVFSRQADALAAIKRYNNVQLDGKYMKLEIVGTNIGTPAAVPLPSNANFMNSNGFPRGGRALGRNRGSGRGRGPGREGRGRGSGSGIGSGSGSGSGRGRGEKLSAEDLDADLEKYHEEAMQIN